MRVAEEDAALGWRTYTLRPPLRTWDMAGGVLQAWTSVVGTGTTYAARR